MGRLERASAIDVARGAVARVAWYAFDRPCAWSLRARDRPRVAWSGARDDAFIVDARATVDDDAEAILLDALRDADAGKTMHVRGTFEAHLREVRDWLRDALDAPAACATAGLGHSAYGSELFPARLAGFGRDRAFFARACGEACERLMFYYGTVSQRRWYRMTLETTRGRDAGGFEAVNFYTGETIRLTPVEAGLLTLMHAADILSVLTPTRERASTALGFAMYLVSSAADMFRAATRSPSGDAFAWNEYADRLDASISDEIVRRMVVDAPVDARGFRDEAAARAAARLRATRFDAVLVLRATGAFD